MSKRKHTDDSTAAKEPPTKTPRADTAKWECPVCLETRFPLSGACGHSICEFCFDSVTQCPECRKERCFLREQPNWPLAQLCGVERDPNRNALGFAVRRSSLVRTRDVLDRFLGLVCETRGEASTEQVVEMTTTLKRLWDTFHGDIATVYAQSIMTGYRRTLKYPFKVDLTDCAFTGSYMSKHIEEHNPDVNCHPRKINDRTVLYLKPRAHFV